MNITGVKRAFIQAQADYGRAVLSTIFPYDFETYLMALELTDSNNNTIDYFSFPIMPESIQKTEPKRTNIKKSAAGTTVLTSNSFAPEEISIKGNFGRSFKLLLQPKEPSIQGVAFSIKAGKYGASDRGSLTLKTPEFNASVKTGYGATRILQSIIGKANSVDKQGKPYRLYFYNMALGEQYLVAVPPSGLTLSMNKDKNMIWDYSLSLTVIAHLSKLQLEKKPTSLLRMATVGSIQNGINKVSSSIVSSFNL